MTSSDNMAHTCVRPTFISCLLFQEYMMHSCTTLYYAVAITWHVPHHWCTV